MSFYQFAFAPLFMLCTVTLSIDAVAQDTENSDKEMRILEKFLGTWDTKYIGPKDLTTKSTYERILGGRYIQRTSTFRAADIDLQILELMTYSSVEKCYRRWTHSSNPRLGVIEYRGTWDEVTQTMTWEAQFKDGATRTSTTKFESESMMKTTISGKDPNGNLRDNFAETVATLRQKP